MNWSAEQHRLLDALGYEVLAHGRAVPRAAVAGALAPTAVAERQGPTAAPASTLRLLEALRRAANGADPRPLAGDLDDLRRDPARKRALWPRLRALRRTTQ